MLCNYHIYIYIYTTGVSVSDKRRTTKRFQHSSHTSDSVHRVGCAGPYSFRSVAVSLVFSTSLVILPSPLALYIGVGGL